MNNNLPQNFIQTLIAFIQNMFDQLLEGGADPGLKGLSLEERLRQGNLDYEKELQPVRERMKTDLRMQSAWYEQKADTMTLEERKEHQLAYLKSIEAWSEQAEETVGATAEHNARNIWENTRREIIDMAERVKDLGLRIGPSGKPLDRIGGSDRES